MMNRRSRSRFCRLSKNSRNVPALATGATIRRSPSPAKAPSRSEATGLAQGVEQLAAQLEQTRAGITDLEAKVDIDPLTELLNRRSVERELTRSVAYVKRYGTSAALVYLDFDELKPVNDRHGHAAGDGVLKAVAAALVRHVRVSTWARASAATSLLSRRGMSPGLTP
jgi:PleD family two-component response regulator